MKNGTGDLNKQEKRKSNSILSDKSAKKHIFGPKLTVTDLAISVDLNGLYTWIQEADFRQISNQMKLERSLKFILDNLKNYSTQLNCLEQEYAKKDQHSLSSLLLHHPGSIEVAIAFFESLSDATIQSSHKNSSPFFDAKARTLLSIAIQEMLKYENSELCQQGRSKWFYEIIDYLLNKRNFDPDQSEIDGFSLITYCLMQINYATPLIDELSKKILEKTKNVNKQHPTLGTTALHIAAKKDPAFVKTLLEKGAYYHLRSSNGLFQASTFTPLLFATACNNIDCVNLLLKAGASPNEAPENQFASIGQAFLEPNMTAYQMAVNKGYSRLAECFRKHAKENQIKLKTSLSELETSYRDLNRFVIMPARHFKRMLDYSLMEMDENQIKELESNYGIQCYCEDLNQDKINFIKKAFDYLFNPESPFLKSSLSAYWEPVRIKFLDLIQNKKGTKIFIQNASESDASESAGVCNPQIDSIKLSSICFRSQEDFILVLAHEIGHLFGFSQPNSTSCTPIGFIAAREQDVIFRRKIFERDETIGSALDILESLKNLAGYEADERIVNDELFTRFCVEFPMRLILKNPSISKETLDNILHKVMPNVTRYFADEFITPTVISKSKINSDLIDPPRSISSSLSSSSLSLEQYIFPSRAITPLASKAMKTRCRQLAKESSALAIKRKRQAK